MLTNFIIVYSSEVLNIKKFPVATPREADSRKITLVFLSVKNV